MTVIIQYVGFQSKAIVLEHRFLLRESSIAAHEIKLTILNEAFRSHGVIKMRRISAHSRYCSSSFEIILSEDCWIHCFHCLANQNVSEAKEG